MAAAYASGGGRAGEARALVARLAPRDDDRVGWAELSKVLTRLLVVALAERWRTGWQPADLVHVVNRHLRTLHGRVCAYAIAVEAETYRHTAGSDPTWMAQVDAVTATGLRAGKSAGRGSDEPVSLLELVVPLAGGVHEGLLVAVEALGLLHALPAQPRLCTPPSEWGRTAAPPHRSTGRAPDPKIIERVRGLLAKAESTTFPEEAEAFTVKAQELIARHAIDLALLEGEQATGDVVGRRILIDDPYGRAKSILLGVVARANRCRAVFCEGLGLSTVFGAPRDLDSVELLYASLLTQATAAMTSAGRQGGARARGRSFRQSFLLAFAQRIGERLDEATQAAVDGARAVHGDNVLPVLASRDAAAEEARDAAFPQLRSQRIALNSYEGWIAGTAAADLAHLGPQGQLRAG